MIGVKNKPDVCLLVCIVPLAFSFLAGVLFHSFFCSSRSPYSIKRTARALVRWQTGQSGQSRDIFQQFTSQSHCGHPAGRTRTLVGLSHPLALPRCGGGVSQSISHRWEARGEWDTHIVEDVAYLPPLEDRRRRSSSVSHWIEWGWES